MIGEIIHVVDSTYGRDNIKAKEIPIVKCADPPPKLQIIKNNMITLISKALSTKVVYPLHVLFSAVLKMYYLSTLLKEDEEIEALQNGYLYHVMKHQYLLKEVSFSILRMYWNIYSMLLENEQLKSISTALKM
jgi:hypothetical protein